MGELHFTIKTGVLKAMGYKFQKLFANNYICYTKDIRRYKIRLWSRGKTIEVDCWQGGTKAILDFYKENRNNPIFEETGAFGGKRPMKIQMNPETEEVKMFDWELYRANEILWEEKYVGWQNEIYLKKEDMDLLLKEIDLLTLYR